MTYRQISKKLTTTACIIQGESKGLPPEDSPLMKQAVVVCFCKNIAPAQKSGFDWLV